MFKPWDKVKRIGETVFRYKNRSPLDVIKGHVYTVHSYNRESNRIKLMGYGDFTYNAGCFELVNKEEMSEYTCNKKTPHVHSELIKAWADGATIQYLYAEDTWFDVSSSGPTWAPDTKYRIKPETKPDIVRYLNIRHVSVFSTGPNQCNSDNLKLTFDGETGKLKSAEVIK